MLALAFALPLAWENDNHSGVFILGLINMHCVAVRDRARLSPGPILVKCLVTGSKEKGSPKPLTLEAASCHGVCQQITSTAGLSCLACSDQKNEKQYSAHAKLPTGTHGQGILVVGIMCAVDT